MNQIGEAKKLTYMGAEKSALAVMETDKLTQFVDRWCNRVLKSAEEKDERGRPTATAVAAINEVDDYMDEQKAMFKSRGMNEQRAYREAIVPTGEVFINRLGDRIEKFRIVPRTTTLEPVDERDDNDASVRVSHSYSQGIGIERESRRGKYNDAALLIEQSAASVDPEEVVPFCQACV